MLDWAEFEGIWVWLEYELSLLLFALLIKKSPYDVGNIGEVGLKLYKLNCYVYSFLLNP